MRLQKATANLDLPTFVLDGAMKLMQRLAHDAAQEATVANRQAAARARRCAAVAHATLDALDSTAQAAAGDDASSRAASTLLPVVCMHWAEAQEHCAYRWEREMEMMLDLTSGRSSCASAATAAAFAISAAVARSDSAARSAAVRAI